MLSLSSINIIVVVTCSIIIFVCSIMIIIAINIQKVQKQKYNNCLNLIKEKEKESINDSIDSNYKKISSEYPNLDIPGLMQLLYNKFLTFIDKLNNLDTNFDNILNEFMSELYRNKLEVYKLNNCLDIVEGIELINYSLLEYNYEKLKFRITINCFDYKKNQYKIVSGSNLNKVEQILIITYENINKEWLISKYEKIYQKKLSD